MEKPFYKAIILVLASDNDPLYSFFKKVYESYMHENPNIKVFFTYGGGTTFERQTYDLVYDDLKETVMPPDITMKVTRAIEFIDNNFSYDFLIRTNLSTFWDFEKLLQRLETLPKTRCLVGRVNAVPNSVTGTSMVISSDLIKPMLAHQHLINQKFPKYIAEDRLLSGIITNQLGVEIIQSNRFIQLFEKHTEYNEEEITSIIKQAKTTDVDHYRVKNFRGNRMEIDTQIMRLLLKIYYNKELS